MISLRYKLEFKKPNNSKIQKKLKKMSSNFKLIWLKGKNGKNIMKNCWNYFYRKNKRIRKLKILLQALS